MRTTLWSSVNGDIPANLAFTNNFSAVIAPGVGSDSSLNYSPGSIWINGTTTPDSVYICTDATPGAAVWEPITQGSTAGQIVAPAASTPTGPGSTALLKGGAGGSTSGNGGTTSVSGGDATAGNGNGGDLNLLGGSKNGSGVAGVVRTVGVHLVTQGAPNAQTVSATLTAAAVLAGIITVAQGAGAPSALQLPLATAMDAALPTAGAGDAFDFSVINTSVVDAEDASLTTNTGWTLVGEMDVQAHSALAAQGSSGRFRARKTGTGAWTLYRLS